MPNRIIYNCVQPHWQIGILKSSLKDVVEGAELECAWLKSPYRDGWIADPFVLSVSEKEIDLLVEDFRYKDRKGRISKVTVDRQRNVITGRKVLLEGGHYSFPAILRKDGKIFVYPEQSRQHTLELYEYKPEKEALELVETLCEKPLSDAVIHDGRVFATIEDDTQLLSWPLADAENAEAETFTFEESIARNAGDIFTIDSVRYRPAQECNRWYGNALSIQRLENGRFAEIRRIPGMHTLNSYRDVVVVDRKIFPFKWLYWLLGKSDK